MRHPLQSLVRLWFLVWLTLSLLGCGHAEAEGAAEQKARQFYDAVQARNWSAAVGCFAPNTRPSPAALEAHLARNGELMSVSYYVPASVRDHRTTPASWRVNIRATVTYASTKRVEGLVLESRDGKRFDITEYLPVTQWNPE